MQHDSQRLRSKRSRSRLSRADEKAVDAALEKVITQLDQGRMIDWDRIEAMCRSRRRKTEFLKRLRAHLAAREDARVSDR